ncbi:SIMPL domain-containing protein [Bdellovibrio sp. ArHS]|uniref:SIMPL domain-containing protein n=1 Tax=Bdellovibrio sp. ArHS TaxID=1569284 RepID=UPI000B1ACEBF|nr:SIMPL domain-containing protein [Bdellovibrio sp. ArHS]
MNKILSCALLVLTLGVSVANADNLIVVNGVAERGLDPNLVNISISVWAKAPAAKQAQQMAASQFKLVKKVFEDFKIKKEDVQTDNYSLTPEYEYDQKTQQNRMTGFRVTQSLQVTLRKIDEAGNFLDAIVSDKKTTTAGVNVSSLTWDSDKRMQVETAALGDAVRAAKVKAEEIAKAAGVKIKGVGKISSSQNQSPPQPFYATFNKMAAESASTDVAAGQVKVRVEVTAEYEIN